MLSSTLKGRADVANKVVRIGRGLRLQDPVDGSHEGDQIVHCLITLGRREFRVFVFPLQLVEYDVLAFIPPVKLEHIPE